MTRLILGTAQFGSGYGITNGVGRIPDDSVVEILKVAHEAEIDLFDTAPDYGDAQSRLGSLSDPRSSPHYVSKFALPMDGEAAINGDSLYERSLAALQVESLYGLLFHRVADLRDQRANTAWSVLNHAKSTGVISRIGVSIYDHFDLEVAVERFPGLSIVQIPGNVLDRRLLDHPEILRLHDRGVEIHVRSAYLQGLLLADPEKIPPHFGQLAPILEQLRRHANNLNTSTMTLALGFLKNHPFVDAVLVGATTPTELTSTVDAWELVADESTDILVPDIPVEILDPRMWPPRKVGA